MRDCFVAIETLDVTNHFGKRAETQLRHVYRAVRPR